MGLQQITVNRRSFKLEPYPRPITNNAGGDFTLYLSNKYNKIMSDDVNIATTCVYSIYPSHIHQGAEILQPFQWHSTATHNDPKFLGPLSPRVAKPQGLQLQKQQL